MTDFSNRPPDSGFGVSNSSEPSRESPINLLDIPSDLDRVFEDIAAPHPARMPNVRDEIADLRSLKRTSARELIPLGVREAIESPCQRMTQHLRDSGLRQRSERCRSTRSALIAVFAPGSQGY